jgi:hypothetical protein
MWWCTAWPGPLHTSGNGDKVSMEQWHTERKEKGLQVGLTHEAAWIESVTAHLCHDGTKGDHVQSENHVGQSSWNIQQMSQSYYKLLDCMFLRFINLLMDYLTTLSVAQTVQHQTVGWSVNNNGKGFQRSGSGLIWGTIPACAWRLGKIMGNLSQEHVHTKTPGMVGAVSLQYTPDYLC